MISFLNNVFPGISPDKGDSRVSGSGESAPHSDTAQLFSQGLKKGIGVELPAVPASDPSAPIFDVQAVVDTVAAFIEQRIMQERDGGASQEELAELLAQAREGVVKGFDLARGDIESLGLLEPALADNIDAAQSGVAGRIDQLEENLAPPEEGLLSRLSDVSISESRSFERSRASLQFELTTQEGDRVRISARELFQSQVRSSAIESDAGSISSVDARFSYASSFSLKVQGDLNEDERAAIDALLMQVMDVSDAFFSGGVEDAFNQALSLNFEGDQIARFSLDLKASSVSISERTDITTTSQPVRIPEEYRSPELPKGLQTVLSNYADKVRELLESAQDFSKSLALLESGDSLAKTLQREFDQSVGRGNGQKDFFDALINHLS